MKEHNRTNVHALQNPIRAQVLDSLFMAPSAWQKYQGAY